MNDMDYFFNPRSIAVIGVSKNPGKIGSIIFQNLFESGYKGSFYPVNPNADSVFGRKCYASVKEIENDIDMAVVAIPAGGAAQAVRDCAEKGVKACIVVTAGFSEIGKIEAENDLVAAAGGMRMLGPNVIGVYDAYTGVDTVFNARYRQGRPGKGGIAFISQSGAFGAAVMDWCVNEGIGLSRFASIGNRADVDEADLLEYLSMDESTKVIALYLEGAKNGRRFYEKLKEASSKKPVIVIKSGKSREGGRVAMSHTGSLAGSAQVYSGAFRQAGAIEAVTSEELFDFAKAATLPKMKSGSVQIITNGGGFGVIATDAVVENGLKLAEMSRETVEKIKVCVTEFATVGNPTDLTGNSTAGMYEAAIAGALEDKSVGAVMVVLLLQVSALESSVVDVIARSAASGKPVVVCSTGGEFTDAHKKLLEEGGVPVYPTPERAVRALKALAILSKTI